MLKIARKLSDLNFSKLMDVYIEGNLENGRENYLTLSPQEQLRNAEIDFYNYLESGFFRQKDSFYCVWEEGGRYTAALRIEPYSDGALLSALETAPDVRRQGYATALVLSVESYLSSIGNVKIYSHVSKNNTASLAAHMKFGFQVFKNYAVYSDGSVLQNLYTLLYHDKKSEI